MARMGAWTIRTKLGSSLPLAVLLLCACEPLDEGGGAGIGGRIAFVRDGILVTSADSGDGELLITDPGTSADPVLSANGQSVVFAFHPSRDLAASGLYRVASSGGTPERLIDPPMGTGFSAPAFSPDGQTIAFVATTGADSEVWTVPASGGSGAPVKGGHKDLRFPAWLDARTLIVSKGAGLALHRLDLGTGALTPVGVASRSRAAISPDGLRIAYAASSPLAIRVRDIASGAETSIATTGNGDANPAFSPDGRFVAFDAKGASEATPKIYAAHADGTPGVVLLQTGNSVSWGP
jgi:Tol biopolymer transport system component